MGRRLSGSDMHNPDTYSHHTYSSAGALEEAAMNDTWNAWDYPEDVDVGGGDLIGYSVVARDGEIGKVDEATVTAGSSHVVVDTGPWIFGDV